MVKHIRFGLVVATMLSCLAGLSMALFYRTGAGRDLISWDVYYAIVPTADLDPVSKSTYREKSQKAAAALSRRYDPAILGLFLGLISSVVALFSLRRAARIQG